MTKVENIKENIEKKIKRNKKEKGIPYWIVVTGLDGSGKTNLVNNLAEYYRSLGFRVETAHLPYDKYLQTELLPKLNSSYADRLLFALDNWSFAEELKRMDVDIIISQRGWLDSFVHGAVKDFTYSFIASLNRVDELPECDVMIHLCANSEIAYRRIKDDPDADKFEFPAYIRKQEASTRQAYQDIISGDPDLVAFFQAKNLFIDTSNITIKETFAKAKRFLNDIVW